MAGNINGADVHHFVAPLAVTLKTKPWVHVAALLKHHLTFGKAGTLRLYISKIWINGNLVVDLSSDTEATTLTGELGFDAPDVVGLAKNDGTVGGTNGLLKGAIAAPMIAYFSTTQTPPGQLTDDQFEALAKALFLRYYYEPTLTIGGPVVQPIAEGTSRIVSAGVEIREVTRVIYEVPRVPPSLKEVI